MLLDGAIVVTMMPAWPLLDQEEMRAVVVAVPPRVSRAIANAPFHIRLAARSISILLRPCIFLISVGAGGRLATALRADKFYTFLQRLPGPIRSVLRLYRSITLLAFYEQTNVAAKLLAARN